MFCRSLRKRREWRSIPSTLLASKVPQWKETNLQTHDIALPIPDSPIPNDCFRCLLLSATDVQDTGNDTKQRIDRLSHLTGGHHVGIFFLLNEKHASTSGPCNGTISYLKLQNELLITHAELPIIPVSSLENLSTTMMTFHRPLLSTASNLGALPGSTSSAVMTLLPRCSTGSELPERVVHVLSDICHSLGELATASRSEEGQRTLRSWLDDVQPGAAERIIEFWRKEYICE